MKIDLSKIYFIECLRTSIILYQRLMLLHPTPLADSSVARPFGTALPQNDYDKQLPCHSERSPDAFVGTK